MSYDLLVFNPSKAPTNPKDFMTWYENQTKWEEDHGYNDPKVSSIELKNWFLDIIKDFPAMNGPYASDNDDDLDDPKVTDYSVAKDIIYASFRWSEAEHAYPKMIDLAEKHNVGFFDASGSNHIYVPNKNGELVKMRDNKSKAWWKIW